MSKVVADLPATFTTKVARNQGVHPRDLYRLRDEGVLVELSRGVFRQADAPTPSLPDQLAVAYRVPNAITCCVSAAAIHDLTDEIPISVQIAVPRSQRPPRIDFPPVEVFRFAAVTFEVGVSSIEAAPGENVRVYGPERTVVDLIRLRRRLGEPLALGALRRYLRRRDSRPGRLLELARALNVFGPVRGYVDVLGVE